MTPWPKSIALYVLSALMVAFAALCLWQRGTLKEKDNTITRQTASIEALEKEKKGLQGQVSDYKANLAAAKTVQLQHQQVQTTTAQLKEEMQQFKTVTILEESDEKILSDYTYYFNSHGLRRTEAGSSHSKANGKILSGSGAPDADRPRWTVRQIVSNYLELIDYILKLEDTVECYEQTYREEK
ncbi:MAG: hypothetical protein ABFD75_11270 [Smithella sp.]